MAYDKQLLIVWSYLPRYFATSTGRFASRVVDTSVMNSWISTSNWYIAYSWTSLEDIGVTCTRRTSAANNNFNGASGDVLLMVYCDTSGRTCSGTCGGSYYLRANGGEINSCAVITSTGVLCAGGATCSYNSQCASGLCGLGNCCGSAYASNCNNCGVTSSGYCLSCNSGYTLSYGSCVRTPKNGGDVCSYNSECASGLCGLGNCCGSAFASNCNNCGTTSPGYCLSCNSGYTLSYGSCVRAELKGPGELCSYNSECLSGVCGLGNCCDSAYASNCNNCGTTTSGYCLNCNSGYHVESGYCRQNSAPTPDASTLPLRAIIGIVVGGGVLLIGIISVSVFCACRKGNTATKQPPVTVAALTNPVLVHTYAPGYYAPNNNLNSGSTQFEGFNPMANSAMPPH